MSKEKKAKQRLDWHSGFAGSFNLGFRDYRSNISIIREHPLSAEPLKIDFLVLKNDSGIYIDNAVGRAFRKHNIVEYKNPNDELNVDVLWKTIGYAGIYKSLGKRVNEIKAEDLTITLFRIRKPVKMFKHLEKTSYRVEMTDAGVYQIHGIINIPVQVVVMKELDDVAFRAMKVLMEGASEEDVEQFILEAGKYSNIEDKRSVDAVLQVSAKVNSKLFEKLRGDNDMCEALRELMADDLKKAESKGLKLGISGSVEILRSVGMEDSLILEKIMEQYSLKKKEAKKYL